MNSFSENELFSPPLDLIKQAVLGTSPEKETEESHVESIQLPISERPDSLFIEFPGIEIVNYPISDDTFISVAKIPPELYESLKDDPKLIQMHKPCSTCVANEILCLHIPGIFSLKGKKKLFESFYDDDPENFMKEFQA